MNTNSLRRRLGALCLPWVSLLLLQGCASTVPVLPPEYPTLGARRAIVVVNTHDGRIFEFRELSSDSARFLGPVRVVKSILGRDGRLEPLETVEWTRVPFDLVSRVTLRRTSTLGTIALGLGSATAFTLLIRSFQPTPANTGGTGGGGGIGGQKAPGLPH